MHVRTNAATYAHYCENPFAMTMTVARMVQWTTKHGVDASSATAFALFGLIQVKLFGANKLGDQFAQLALAFLDNLEDKTVESRVTYIVWFFVAPRSLCPIQSTLKHLLHGYKVGMEGVCFLPMSPPPPLGMR